MASRYSRPAASRSACRRTLLPQVIERPGTRAPEARHRQAEELCRSATNGHAFRYPRHRPIREQSSRGFPPADPTAGATNAKVQVVCSSPAILVGARNHPESLPCRTTPVAGSQPTDVAGLRLPRLERDHVCLTNSEVDDRCAGPHSDDAKLTKPSGGIPIFSSSRVAIGVPPNASSASY